MSARAPGKELPQGKREKLQEKHQSEQALLSPLELLTVLPHRDPCSSLMPVGNTSSSGYCNESRKEKKGREEEIILEALLSLARVFFFMESIASSWVSDTTGAFCRTFQTVVWVHSMSLTRP